MAINPLAWQERDYSEGVGPVERWHIDFVNGRAYHCKRVSFPGADAMKRAMVALALSSALVKTHREASDAALSTSLAESTTTIGSFHSAATAVAFFANGRETALQTAHDIVAAVDPRAGVLWR
jgi:hypothetical protein